MPDGMQKGGQLLFPGVKPALIATHEYDRFGLENIQQALFLIPAEAYANHGFQVLAALDHQGLKALFRERCGNRRRCHRKLSWHNLREPENDSGAQATGPFVCRV
jgi:hypothetical protein